MQQHVQHLAFKSFHTALIISYVTNFSKKHILLKITTLKLLSLFLSALTIVNLSYGQSKNINYNAAPSWATATGFDSATTALDREAEDGYIYQYYSIQVNLNTQSEYHHYTKRILSEAGVQNASDISINFDPSYQKLTIHSIKIIRGGVEQNKLDRSKVKVIQQEKDLKDFIYDGSLNAIEILEDVRAGDIIDCSYSIQGFNPIFKGEYSDALSTGFSVPIYKVYYKIIIKDTSAFNYKSLAKDVSPVISESKTKKFLNGQKQTFTLLISRIIRLPGMRPFLKLCSALIIRGSKLVVGHSPSSQHQLSFQVN